MHAANSPCRTSGFFLVLRNRTAFRLDSLLVIQVGEELAYQSVQSVAVAPDGSFFLAGETTGDWASINEGEADFAVAKLDSDGALLWTWQVKERSSSPWSEHFLVGQMSCA